MFLLVCKEAVQATEICTTFFTNKRPIARVNAHVHFEAVRAGVLGEADAALVGFLTGVLAPVLLESVGDGETPATVLTHIGLVSSVGSTMDNQTACKSNTEKNAGFRNAMKFDTVTASVIYTECITCSLY